jgi:hypothetical protein
LSKGVNSNGCLGYCNWAGIGCVVSVLGICEGATSLVVGGLGIYQAPTSFVVGGLGY